MRKVFSTPRSWSRGGEWGEREEPHEPLPSGVSNGLEPGRSTAHGQSGRVEVGPQSGLRKRGAASLLQGGPVVRGKLRRSAIFVGHVNVESKSEPRRGGILLAAGGYSAPPELQPAAGGAVCYKDSTPTELGAAASAALPGAILLPPRWGSGKANHP